MRTQTDEAPARRTRETGFTLVDLLTLICAVAFLAAVMSHALGDARDGSRTLQCLNHHRQLINAWQMYAADNGGKLVINGHGGSAFGGNAPYNSWASGWLDWSTSSDNTNTVFLVGERYSTFSSYFNRAARVFQCPADTFVSQVQRARGFERRARSYSMSTAVGSPNATSGPFSSSYKSVLTMDGFHKPAPGNVFVFIDEHPDGINDPAFFPPDPSFNDLPGALHNGAAGVSFADGHAEAHMWEGPQVPRYPVAFRDLSYMFATPTDRDLIWLRDHTPKR